MMVIDGDIVCMDQPDDLNAHLNEHRSFLVHEAQEGESLVTHCLFLFNRNSSQDNRCRQARYPLLSVRQSFFEI